LAGKHRKERVRHAPTKHQLSRWEKEKKLSRIITISVGCVVLVAAALIGFWLYSEQIAPYQKTVVKANDASFNYDYYIKFLDAVTKGAGKDTLQYYPDMAVSAIQQAEVVKEKAAEVGITATDEEVSKALEQAGLDKNSAAEDLTRFRLETSKYAQQQCLPKQPQSVQQANLEAMFLESKGDADGIRQKLILGENFTAAAGKLSVEQVTKTKYGNLGWVPKGYENYALGNLQDSALKDAIFTLEPKTWSNPIHDSATQKAYGYWVVQLLEKDDAKGLHARGILFSEKQQGEDVRQQLLNGGSWDTLAKQYSQHEASKDSGGDLGWTLPGAQAGMMARILAAQEQNKISDVLRDDSVTTKGGYWVAQVTELQDRPLASTIRDALLQQCLGEWVQGLMKDAKTENLLDDTQKSLAIDKISKKRS
jgi:hypothetical protein